MTKLGFLVNNLGPSQLNYHLIRNINQLLTQRHDLDVVVFYEGLARPCLSMQFATMQMAEAWAFTGATVATTFSTAQKLIRFPGPARKFFYVWDLEWLRGPALKFRELQSVYGHPSLHLLARSKEHASVIGQCWNRSVGTVEDVGLAELFREMSFT